MRLCSGAGCGRAVDEAGPRYCDECIAERKPVVSDDIRSNAVSDRERYATLYSSRRWHSGIRLLALKRHPICSKCDLALSEIVDHVVPAGVAIQQAQDSKRYPYDKWAGFFMMSNLTGLCRVCHAKKTDEDKQHVGPWPNVVDVEAKKEVKRWIF